MRSPVTIGYYQAAVSPLESSLSLIHRHPTATRCIYSFAIRHDRLTTYAAAYYRRAYSKPAITIHRNPARKLPIVTRRATSTDTAVEKRDDYNPPRSTLPPEVGKVDRGEKSLFAYLWQLTKTYGKFYKTGGAAIWSNRTLATHVRERLKKAAAIQVSFDPFDQQLLTAAVKANAISRSDFQLLRRYKHDYTRLPLFFVLLLLVGEWLPLVVPFIPYAVPLTCRIPSQIEQMRTKVEERRRLVFRQGIEIPSEEQLTESLAEQQGRQWLLLDRPLIQPLLHRLRSEQIWYLSCVLNLHSRSWESVQQRPPVWMMRSRLARKLQYLAQDDLLLTRGGGNAASTLSDQELRIACEERGLDVLGPSSKQLQQQLAGWLRRQTENEGRGTAMVHMLFRRPNSWS